MAWLSRIRNFVFQSRVIDEIDAELRFHIEQRVNELVESGLSRQEAEREARLRFGRPSATREEALTVKLSSRPVFLCTSDLMRSFFQDLHYAFRTLRAAPGFASAALLTLALGIGANTVIFSVINNVLLSPPNFRHLDRLAIVFDVNRRAAASPEADMNPSPGNFLEWRQQTAAFDQMVAWRNWYYSLAGPEGGREIPESVRGVRVSPGFFSGSER